MIWGCGMGFDAPNLHELRPQCRRKLGATISCDRLWDTEVGDPIVGKCVYDGLSRGVLNRNGRWPTRKAVHDGQKTLETVRQRHRHQIQIDVIEPFVWHLKLANRGHHMPQNLGALAF